MAEQVTTLVIYFFSLVIYFFQPGDVAVLHLMQTFIFLLQRKQVRKLSNADTGSPPLLIQMSYFS